MNVSWFCALPRMAVLAGAVLCCVVALPTATAQQGHPPTESAAGRTASQTLEAGEVYLPRSRVYVFVGKTGFGHEHAVVGQLSQGRMRLDLPQHPGQLVFDLRTFVADTDSARKAIGLEGTTDASTRQEVTANMLGQYVLDVAHFPTAVFDVRSVQQLPQPSQSGQTQFQVDGDFTLHGVSKPLQFVAEAEEQGPWIHVRGKFNMLQSQYGITPFTKAFGAIGVSDQLTVWGDLWLAKERQVVTTPAASP